MPLRTVSTHINEAKIANAVRQCFTRRILSLLRSARQLQYLLSDVLPFGRLWYTKPDDAIGYATFYSRSHDAVIRVYGPAGNVTGTNEHKGDFKEW